MGGDFAPKAVVDGAVMAAGELESQSVIVLYGDAATIETLLRANDYGDNNIEIVPTTQIISMSDHPTVAFSKKPDSSITVGFRHLKEGRIDSFASAGSTGAMLVGSMYSAKTIRNIIRPAISARVATVDGGDFVLLDVGLNVDCKPDVLYQYGIIGRVYAKAVMGKENPRVALLNIGEERTKGNLAVKAAYDMLVEDDTINFVGNIEARDIYSGAIADVVVCDGFVGNTILKQTEGFYELANHRGIKDDYIDRFNPSLVGGTPVLGLNANVIIGHGNSSALAIKNMILQAQETISSGLVDKLQNTFNDL